MGNTNVLSVPNALQALVAVAGNGHGDVVFIRSCPSSSPLHLQIANFSSKSWNNCSFLMLYEFIFLIMGDKKAESFFSRFHPKVDRITSKSEDSAGKVTGKKRQHQTPQCSVTCRTVCSKLASSTTSRVSNQCIIH